MNCEKREWKKKQQTVGIPMGTNCAPLLADIFLYSYEADFVQSLLSTGKKHLASRFNLTYRYIDDVLSINNTEFENYLGQMYPAELEIKDTTENTTSASYLDLLLSIGRDGQLHTSIYDKRDDFNFHITKFPPFWDLLFANAPIVETKFLELAMSLLDFSTQIPLGTFSILLYHYPCTTAGGQFVPEGTCRVVIIYEWREKETWKWLRRRPL